MSHRTDEMKSVFFPSHCVFCKRGVKEQYLAICDKCAKQLPEPPAKRHGEFFSVCISAMPYDDTVRSSVLHMKLDPRVSYCETYGRMIAARVREELKDKFDLVSWIPTSPLHRVKRGFDQGEMMAQTVAAELELPLQKLLKRRLFSRAQSNIPDAARRRANVLNAYRTVEDPAIDGKCILLIDDVITTGATLSECSRVLRLAGASRIVGATFAATNKSR